MKSNKKTQDTQRKIRFDTNEYVDECHVSAKKLSEWAFEFVDTKVSVSLAKHDCTWVNYITQRLQQKCDEATIFTRWWWKRRLKHATELDKRIHDTYLNALVEFRNCCERMEREVLDNS